MIVEQAPAKLNLCLHVTGQRADGYHLLDSLVAFTEAGDRLTAEPGPLALALTGPFGQALEGEQDNLVLRAARLIGAEAKLTLEKRLPLASGIGGGSADAAATLRALARLHGLPLPDSLPLGADVPVCLEARARRMRGVGEHLSPPVPLPTCPVLLVNPGVAVPTPAVFRALAHKNNPPLPDELPPLDSLPALLDFLRATRNDLEAPARALAPEISAVLAALSAQGAALARMSGSGATCFGLFPEGTSGAARALRAAQPGWWVCETRLP